MAFLPFTLLLLSFVSQDAGVYAAQGNQSCSQNDQRLQLGTYQFTTDCDAMWFCNSTQICDWKGCRRDQYPFGYWANVSLPHLCPTGQFCPDEEDQCQDVLPVGSACQFNRDDQCLGPPNFEELADTSGFGLNVNGSVCLNNVCQWANITAGDTCIIENTPYIVYTAASEFIDIISRDNCKIGLYCDATAKQCMAQKDLKASCTADKECLTYNCNGSGVCDKPADTPNHVGFWVYIVVGVAIFGGMFATLISMFFLHRKQRAADKEKRLQYWREQNAFRQNILQMQETARNSIMSLPMGNSNNRESVYSNQVGSDESQIPLTGAGKSSGLRHYVSDDGFNDNDDGVMMRDRKQGTRF